MTWRVLRQGDRDFAPLVVRAHMSEPIIYTGDGMHLDGILAAAAFRDMDERTRRRIPPLSSEWAVDIKIPLAKWVIDVGKEWDGGDRRLLRKPDRSELWGWCASAVQADWLQYGKTEVRKKPELDKMRRYAGDKSVSITAGPLKAYDLPFPTVWAPVLTWYALGDAGEVLRLLTTHIQALGKKHLLGNGTVLRWEVEGAAHDWSVVRDGVLMRRMPVESGLEGERRRGAVRPPYHHHSRVVEAVEPCST